ncbi:HalOD1 output domain-containing protein [Haloterrigena turkmenica]|uniref:HalOD1 output domain-containing protein n=1 Tax=Haloterrigena turkmenica TaxID=62320 RepID=UPI0009D692BB|nr:HalOD1 output domain-containing protein [Haloterrigena turkmenica]
MGSRDRRETVTDSGSTIFVEEQTNESASQAIIRGIAAVKGVPPRNFQPLYDSVDPEALDGLLEHSRRHSTDTSVEFTHDGCSVLVRSDGEITISYPLPGYE